MKQKRNGKRINAWKWLFFVFVIAELALAIIVFQRITTIREVNLKETVAKLSSTDDIRVGTVSTNREQLNQTVASFLEEYQTKSMTYEVYATMSTIVFEGTYNLLGYDVPLYVYFEPYQLEDGSVQLKITSISAGALPLPEADVLKFIAKSYDLPEIVEVQPKQSSIVIHLENLENTSGIYLKATSIDLVNDAISFDIYKKKPSK
ncbi:YpmS family protein [Streptococcus caprae]|uniref:YpmS family protein n=1 Tax=Streptococcus caprae TaxID=1640501 RepID=A0ABV8CTR2_9STRE